MPDFLPTESLQVPTTDIFTIEDIDVPIPGLKEFLVTLTYNVNNMALAMNMKDTGYYLTTEIANSQSYFNASGNTLVAGTEPRSVYRTVVWWNQPLPNAATATMPHNIQGITPATTFRFTRIYGCATNPALPEFIPLPYSSTIAAANNIELSANQINVTIRTGVNRSNFTSAFIVLEYVKES